MLRRLAVVTIASLAVACGSGETTSPAVSATDSGTPAIDTGVPIVDDAGVLHEAQAASIQLDLLPGRERTVCITIRLANPEAMMITKMNGELMPGSHHLLIYRSAATAESLTPRDCSPFAGLLGGKEIMIGEVTKPKVEQQMPPNVGFKIDANQMIKLEAHYINTTTKPITGKGRWSFEGVPMSKAAGMLEANGMFWGTSKIKIPAKSGYDTGVKFQSAIAGTKGFMVTTHQHRFGKKMTVWSSSKPTTAGETPANPPIVAEENWAEPAIVSIDPHLPFDGSNGLAYKCEYDNTSDAEVTFGESALEEMCFLFAWYYPSKHFDICIDGTCLNR